MKHIIDKISLVSQNAIIIAVASLASRLLGLFRDRILASEFGAGRVLDTYYAAFRIPDLIFNLLILGALSSAFIPIFSELLFKDEKEAWRVVNNFINIILSVLIGAMLIFFIFAPWIMKLITPGFNSAQLGDVTKLTRIMLLSPLFFSLSSIIGGVLNSFGRFFVYSLAPILYNIGIICGALFLTPIFGITGLAWGVVIGAAAHMLVQAPTFFKVGFRFQKIFNWKDVYFRRIVALMIPVTIGLALDQINLLVDNIIGSTLAKGSISIINLATNLVSMPIGLIGVSFAVSVFPILSYALCRKEDAIFVKNFTSTFKTMLYLLIPAMVFLLIFRAYIVRLILGAGLFDVDNTIWTARTFGYLSLGLVAEGLIPFIVRAFYASGDTKTPVKVVFVSFIVNAIGSIVFTKVFNFQVVGLALAGIIASFTNILILLVIFKERFKQIDLNQLFLATGKYFIFSIIAGISSYFMLYYAANYFDTLTTIGLFGQTAMAGITGLFVYILLSTIFKVPEAQKLVDGATGIFRKLLK